MVLGGLAEMSRTFVFNPDDRIVGVMALVVHYCFHQNVRRNRKSKDQGGQRAA